MVLLAASICTKDGKALLSRQFVEMTKARIEGLIATFPKLLGAGKQHTFVETESVRYVYQPLERLYVLLITTKASNILEDLETLRLFARVIPEYACGTEESDVLNNAFQIIFAFDEIVSLGYREDVNVMQIRTFTEMDSHEERIFRAVRESKEREAKEQMKQRARELHQARLDAAKHGVSNTSGIGGSYNKISGGGLIEPQLITTPSGGRSAFDDTSSTLTSHGPKRGPTGTGGGGMQLGGGGRGMTPGLGGVDQFVDKLKAEGAIVSDVQEPGSAPSSSLNKPSTMTKKANISSGKEDVQIRIEEKLIIQAGRDGGLETMELQGILHVCAQSELANSARLHVHTASATNPPDPEHQPPAQLQTHPNIDKKVFSTSSWIQTKAGGKPYPQGQEVGVLKWRIQTQDEAMLPLSINCWPNEIPGGFEVNIEYELLNTKLELHDVVILIPLPNSSKSPAIGNCNGEYTVNSRKTQLEWRLPLVDADNTSGSIDFTIKTERGTKADQFFPLQVSFRSDLSFCNIRAIEVKTPDDHALTFSVDTNFHTEKFEIV